MRLFHDTVQSCKQVGLVVRKHVFGKGTENLFALGKLGVMIGRKRR